MGLSLIVPREGSAGRRLCLSPVLRAHAAPISPIFSPDSPCPQRCPTPKGSVSPSHPGPANSPASAGQSCPTLRFSSSLARSWGSDVFSGDLISCSCSERFLVLPVPCPSSSELPGLALGPLPSACWEMRAGLHLLGAFTPSRLPQIEPCLGSP